MGLFNPVYAFVIPFLITFTIPIAIFAGITTSFAFILLIFRVIFVYLDLILALVPSYFTFRSRHRRRHHRYSSSSSPSSLRKSPSTASSSGFLHGKHPAHHSDSRSPSPTLSTSHRSVSMSRTYRHRSRSARRPSSGGSAASLAGSITPIANEGGLGLFPSIGMDRDFEGVGGWRMGGGVEDEQQWTAMNSRLELPDRQYGAGRNHHRSSSAGTDGGGLWMMKGRSSRTRSGSPESVIFAPNGPGSATRGAAVSPNSSRVRTPGAGVPSALTTRDHDGGYFVSHHGTSLPVSSRSSKKMAAA